MTTQEGSSLKTGHQPGRVEWSCKAVLNGFPNWWVVTPRGASNDLMIGGGRQVLRWCAEQGRVSLLACLGDQAAAVRSAWLTALESPLDDAGAVDAVLRLLAVAVRNQPGLVHLLVNGKPTETRCNLILPSLTSFLGPSLLIEDWMAFS